MWIHSSTWISSELCVLKTISCSRKFLLWHFRITCFNIFAFKTLRARNNTKIINFNNECRVFSTPDLDGFPNTVVVLFVFYPFSLHSHVLQILQPLLNHCVHGIAQISSLLTLRYFKFFWACIKTWYSLWHYKCEIK